MLGSAQGVRIGITGLGVHVPAKVMTNQELAEIVETSDEWIRERTGIRERRIASKDEALTDIALPAARAALDDAGVAAKDIDLLICATVTPEPTTAPPKQSPAMSAFNFIPFFSLIGPASLRRDRTSWDPLLQQTCRPRRPPLCWPHNQIRASRRGTLHKRPQRPAELVLFNRASVADLA